MVTVALVDDHAIVRQGLRALLESDPNLKVVGEAANGLEAIKLVKRRKPQVVICDLMMPGLNGLETTRKVLRLKLKTRVIMLSMYQNEAYVLEALKGGAAGYVVKESSGAELFQAIRVVVAGRRYVSPALSKEPAVALVLSSAGCSGMTDEQQRGERWCDGRSGRGCPGGDHGRKCRYRSGHRGAHRDCRRLIYNEMKKDKSEEK